MSEHVYDCLVVGAGPAGLQLGALLQAESRDYLIVEAGPAPGTFFTVYPRHRTLISINKPHTGTTDPELNLRMDWNSLLSDDPDLLFTRYTERYFPPADELPRYLGDFAKALGLRVAFDAPVVRVDREEDGVFVVEVGAGGEGGTEGGTAYRARRVVMATGVGRLYVPPIPGIELVERYDTMPTDPAGFVDQRVLIIGKGNSALETADNLIEKAAVIHVAGPSSLRLAWQSHYVGHVRAVNNNFLDTYQLKSQNAVLDGTVRSIEPVDGGGFLVRFAFMRADEVVKELFYDRVIACTGFRFDASVFGEGTQPSLAIDDRFPEQTSSYESVNVPGLYFAGTLMQQRDFKKATTGFIHGFRYTVRALHHILEQETQGIAWPYREVEGTADGLTAAVLDRVNRSSALWQQFGVMGDLVVLPEGAGGAGAARYYEEVPVAYALDGKLTTGAGGEPVTEFLAVTLEYGPDHDKVDPFDVTVRRTAQDRPEEALDAAYLHPVVRHYRDGKEIAVHHVAENLENEWNKPQAHRDPLAAFFERIAR
ncbi:MAG TPA: NAD(P)-binding domain-containing protein [Actinocrinis sp.]|nr:NAD(P)-binding domain-containing protein [Actinocrinis sp.]